VGLQVAFGDEALVAALNSAHERSFTSMYSQMGFQIASFLEASLARHEGAKQVFVLLETTSHSLQFHERVYDVYLTQVILSVIKKGAVEIFRVVGLLHFLIFASLAELYVEPSWSVIHGGLLSVRSVGRRHA